MPSKETMSSLYESFFQDFMDQYGASSAAQWVGDIFTCWQILPIGAVIAFLLGFVFMILLKLLAGVIVWISIILIFIGFAAGGGFCFVKWDDLKSQRVATEEETGTVEETDKFSTENKYMYAMIGLWAIALVYVLLILCLLGRIRLGVAIFKCTASFIGSNPLIFIVPIVGLVLILVWVVVWGFFAAFIYTIGYIEPWDTFEAISNIVWDDTTRKVWWYHIFALLWINAFIIGCG